MAQQLSARPSIVSVASEEGTYSLQTQPLPSDFGFVPSFKVNFLLPYLIDKDLLKIRAKSEIDTLILASNDAIN